MATALALGFGVAAAAFFVRITSCSGVQASSDSTFQGRAGLVALRRYRGGTSALGKAFYKGGFEPKMTRREAALILETSYVLP